MYLTVPGLELRRSMISDQMATLHALPQIMKVLKKFLTCFLTFFKHAEMKPQQRIIEVRFPNKLVIMTTVAHKNKFEL